MLHMFFDSLLTGLLGAAAFLIVTARLRAVALRGARNLKPGPEPRCLRPLLPNGRPAEH
jgi:hypothetical protein